MCVVASANCMFQQCCRRITTSPTCVLLQCCNERSMCVDAVLLQYCDKCNLCIAAVLRRAQHVCCGEYAVCVVSSLACVCVAAVLR